jgi:nucleoside-diphosphate-sugar epimerase
MRRALVTGATGGLGLALVSALLAHGYEVRATGRSRAAGERLSAAGAEFVAADLTDPAAIAPLAADRDVAFHAAALSSVWGPPAAFAAINVLATERLLAAARQAGCDAFIFVSTARWRGGSPTPTRRPSSRPSSGCGRPTRPASPL